MFCALEDVEGYKDRKYRRMLIVIVSLEWNFFTMFVVFWNRHVIWTTSGEAVERSEQRRPKDEESRRRKSEAMKAMGSGMGWSSDGVVRAIEWEVWHHSDCRKPVYRPKMIQSMIALSNVSCCCVASWSR